MTPLRWAPPCSDQYRGIPRAHAFDVNAASETDLLTVPGMTRTSARAMLRPHAGASIDDLRRVNGTTDGCSRRSVTCTTRLSASRRGRTRRNRCRFEPFSCPMSGARSRCTSCAQRRLLPCIELCGAAIGRGARHPQPAGEHHFRIRRPLAGGNRTGLFAFELPVILFGLPAASVRCGAREPERPPRGHVVLAAWTVASLPAALAVRPMG